MDFSWSELLVVGIVALVIIGPKDLPGMFRELGRITAKIRAMGREFSRAMEQAAKESGVKDVADDLRKVTSPGAMGLDAVKSAADRFEKWDPLKNAAVPTKPLTPAPMPPAAPTATAAASAPEAAGPATAALYEKQAARKAVAGEAAAKLRSIARPDAAAAAAAPKAPGRRRKKPEAPAGDDA
ncbi:twin-arginine translocase TatA/TatE family subunit [Tabrizicola sp.]|jgi:sec-independent protein translocase protein TatB|uniref:Sec-independent protein translocase subunit TatA/TatB n=1 Tax=Tabrizicola sp. TaxID=2005166 RepID=UPI0025FF4338|nr:twin-arginine translocase TatA/TatE family subunit [Tabrizicola sp.]MBY0352036.1 twin-arginine translocase TatA/TatE family subunit [Tabrizicola sp.]MDK2773464.1 twin-arginine translocase TatA/TatE family subunit [Tabrizicola sp.]